MAPSERRHPCPRARQRQGWTTLRRTFASSALAPRREVPLILLPLASEHSSEDGGARSEEHRIKLLLFVEDDSHASEGVSVLLESEGIHVDSVSLGAKAVGALMLARPDAVILDVSFPDAAGFRVHEQLAQRWPDLPIVVLIGNEHPELLGQNAASSNTRFLQKPYDVESLLEKLSAIMNVAS